ncbi:glycosyltransferase [Arthrobacter gandavensis]|uniref:glycosyltransferase n=1 Tax=Arthrobacter gandavensis TaxID=169960 RepID=UPI00188DDB08|nr:glycosyltransferase [Arthrobacter gandavensis]MBF4993009.1 glycosyltransferase [Arthrobacter gandavensis]
MTVKAGRQDTVLVAHPSAELYGSDRVLLESVRGLQDSGARVVVTVPAEGPLISELRECGAEVVLCRTVVLRKALLSPRSLAMLLPASVAATGRMLVLLRELKPHSVYVSTLTLPLWSVLPRLLGLRVVAHVHEGEDSARPLVKRALAAPLLFASRILVNSRFSEAVLHAAQPSLRRRTTVLDNAVPGPPAPLPLRRELHGDARITYVGRLAHRKGVDVAVEAFAELSAAGSAARLDIVGAVYPGNEGYEEQLRQTIRELGLQDRVRLHGFQPDVWPYLAEADIVLVPSRADEPFGNTAVEAILAGRPAVVSDTSGLREAAGNYSCVRLVPPSDPGAIAEAVEKMLAQWSWYCDLAAADALTAASRHSPELYRSRIAAHVLPSRRSYAKGKA